MNSTHMAAVLVKKRQKINGCVSSKPAFTLIELLVAFAIIGLLTTTFLTMFRRPSYEREQFITRLNQLSSLAWQEALMTGKMHRLLFDTTRRTIRVERATTQKDLKGFPVFEPLKQQLTRPEYEWPSSIQIKQFILQGKDELTAVGGKGTIWYAVVPEGLAQQVTINAIDTKRLVRGKPRQFGLVLNPFSAQFKEYDAFQQ